MNWIASQLVGDDDGREEAPPAGGGNMMGGWLNTLKDKAKELGEVYKRDLGEFASQVKHDASAVIESEFGDQEAPPKPKPKPSTPAKRVEVKAANKAVGRVAVVKQPGVSPKLSALREASVTYTHDPPDKAAYDAFAEAFDAKERTTEITEMLKSNSAMEELHKKLCPEQVPYKVFWTRYFFREQALHAEERKTQLLLSASEHLFEEDELGWDDETETHPSSEATPTAAAAQSESVPAPASKEQREDAAGGSDESAGAAAVGDAVGSGSQAQAAQGGGDAPAVLASPSIALKPTEPHSFPEPGAKGGAGGGVKAGEGGARRLDDSAVKVEGGGGGEAGEGEGVADDEGNKGDAAVTATSGAAASLAAGGLGGSVSLSSSGVVGLSEASSSPCVVSAAVSADPSLDNASGTASDGSSNSTKEVASAASKAEDVAAGEVASSAGVVQEAAKPKQDDDWDDWE